ncbi:MAG: [Lentisphaeria bacterium]|nr:[FeFe] hydrogenase H-cluster maturation GTPase HydF [Lentisphaeria bacterium]
MLNTPKGLRLQIGIFGRRNVGKSSLLNALTGQAVSIVSDTPGTTADPVEKPMELLPFGPVLLIDTAGLDDDAGKLGELRAEKSRRILDRTDLALLVTDSGWTPFEEQLADELRDRKVPAIIVFNKSDRTAPPDGLPEKLAAQGFETVRTSASDGTGMDLLRAAILRKAPDDFLDSLGMLDGLAPAGGTILLITPIDQEAPRGRLILPQVQAIRDTLDHDACCLVVKENAVSAALANLKEPPVLAVTDSQAFGTVSKLIPGSIPLTSFSILLARMKGDLAVCAAGAAAIGTLTNDSTVMIAEACSHPPIGEDIGRVKIPNWLRKHGLPGLKFKFVQGHDFPEDLSGIDLVIHCGACMFNRREVLSRILQCVRQHVPFTNYGVAIAYCFGILERALAPFPEALDACRPNGRRDL